MYIKRNKREQSAAAVSPVCGLEEMTGGTEKEEGEEEEEEEEEDLLLNERFLWDDDKDDEADVKKRGGGRGGRSRRMTISPSSSKAILESELHEATEVRGGECLQRPVPLPAVDHAAASAVAGVLHSTSYADEEETSSKQVEMREECTPLPVPASTTGLTAHTSESKMRPPPAEEEDEAAATVATIQAVGGEKEVVEISLTDEFVDDLAMASASSSIEKQAPPPPPPREDVEASCTPTTTQIADDEDDDDVDVVEEVLFVPSSSSLEAIKENESSTSPVSKPDEPEEEEEVEEGGMTVAAAAVEEEVLDLEQAAALAVERYKVRCEMARWKYMWEMASAHAAHTAAALTRR
jgi:hypothetical protein